MAPTPAAVTGLLRQSAQYHLDNANYDNALFFAERLVAHDPKTSEGPYLLATSHLRLRDYRSAYDTSRAAALRGGHLGCTWVFAQACLLLEKFQEGIVTLERSKSSWSYKVNVGKHSPTTRAATPDASVMLCLLGKLYRASDDSKRAAACFEHALKLNPLMWDAFTILCDMGVSVRPQAAFKGSEQLLQSLGQDLSMVNEFKENGAPTDPHARKGLSRHATAPAAMADPFGPSSTVDDDVEMTTAPSNGLLSKIQAARLRIANGPTAEAAHGSHDDVLAPRGQEPPRAPARRTRAAQGVMDASLEPPPRVNYRVGARRIREQEKEEQTRAVVDAVYQETDPANGPERQRSAIPGVERKRTVSGHPVPRPANAEETVPRRSGRLNTFRPTAKANSTATNTAQPAARELKKARPQISRIVRPGSSGSNVGRVVSGNRKPVEDRGDDHHGEQPRVRDVSHAPPPQKHVESDTIKVEEALRVVLDLLKKLGAAYYHLSKYESDAALQALSSLPAVHQGAPSVLALMGRAHFEQGSYLEAETLFRKVRDKAPSRLADLEVYSTVLWHLKKEKELAFLAHQLIESSWESHQAWCVLGNSWSLAKDHDQALRCFKRATQLSPNFAYAWTLQGHEHHDNEEFDKAITAYRKALSADKRHYNAYYGLGRVQLRLGAFDKALTHFRTAAELNPYNAVLVCCVGKALEKQKQIAPAVTAYSKAVELAPQAAQMRYMKARGLLFMGETELAHKELMVLKDLAPEEGTVHFLLGTMYRNMEKRQEAVRHFTIALALDPKAGPKIKDAIERFEYDDPMQDSMIE